MGIEDKEPKRPLFEIGGHPILDFQSIDAENAITFSFVVQIDEPPTPYNMSFSDLMEAGGAWEILKRKKWMDEGGGALVQLNQKRECTVDGHGTYRLNFTYTRKDQIYN